MVKIRRNGNENIIAEMKTSEEIPQRAYQKIPGSVLLSHKENLAVPSAQRSLTTEFGMGSGMAFSL